VNRFGDEDVLRFFDAAVDPDPAKVLDALLRFTGAERGFLVLRQDGGFLVRTSLNMDGDEVERAREKVSATLLARALAEGRPLVAGDAEIAGLESLKGQKVRSVCALPLPASGAAVYLDHASARGLFGDLEALGRVAGRLDAAFQKTRGGHGDLVGTSPPMQELYRTLERVAPAPYPVLIYGESGSGKELVARAVHRGSQRSDRPFVAANCATFPEPLMASTLFGHARGAFTGADRDQAGLFEQAHGGVLFLDEVACLSAGAQESLLRVLETGEVRRVGGEKAERVDVRVVAATNEDLEVSSEFRRDLFYRLNVLRVNVPPLRERREDIPLLAELFLDRHARETGGPRKRLTPAALAALCEGEWPGNVRELQNHVLRAACMTEGGTIDAPAFSLSRRTTPSASARVVSLDEHIKRTLEEWGGTLELQEIADRLGVSRKTLWDKKRKLGLR
jgi:DNA-binding NtrC family response regulator